MKRILIVTGQSGSGKSSALQVLEDLGYYCIDNLPLALLPEIVDKLDQENNLEQLALGVDVRSTRADLQEFDLVFEQLQKHGSVDIIYLTTQDQELIARFSASRRPHPLSSRFKSLNECIQEEKNLLMPIQFRSTVHIDTTDKSVHDLKHVLLSKLGQTDKLIVILQSFGYKHGIPLDADYVFDVRHLPNPHWDLELRKYSGLDAPVQEFLQQSSQTHEMFHDIQQFLEKWLPAFAEGHRHYITISIGCTGGQHRSVYIVDRLKKALEAKWSIQVLHREMKHWS
ncbi:RNase adapter RapZ [Acinetobacter towneri]|uniref:RNase adapter RapZ n=1 Tax=Acinetobacter towneri TaxID=202956 RepID=A0ABX7THA5_9GAMM|nr:MULTISPECIES: RNase adapter RapZ [Acinetobacter]MCA4779558.1 RNase adapter RapZ [Acinetobacter towneri]MCA4784971.1 RNase adapter RapZ [Acinetobacter towneri]MCA4786473.1 RNase adapter RapZ [Acinetobacter towneri]MCA4796129.1 RNase adapter RapZ [Acinetobacter towneri]MCA4801129.1 RNase adapter RapZ [Acinetobacter towneri]